MVEEDVRQITSSLLLMSLVALVLRKSAILIEGRKDTHLFRVVQIVQYL